MSDGGPARGAPAAVTAVVIHDAWQSAQRVVLAPGVMLVVAWLLVVAAFATQLEFFLTITNTITIVNFSVVTFIVAAGFAIVLIGGGIDLSVGSALMMAGVTAAAAFQAGVPTVVAFVLGFAMGPIAGLINGLLVAHLRINPLIATLSMLFVLRAVGFWVADSNIIQVRDPGFRFARELVFGVPVAVYFLVVVFVLSWLFMRRTKLGRHITAIGGNPQAARQAAMNVERHRVGLYVLAGAYSGLAGILLASILGAGDPNAGTGREFSVATAVFLGGASLAGGRGSIVGTLIGVLFITTLANGLTQLGAIPQVVLLVNGVLLIGAVALDHRPKGGFR